MDGSQKIIEFPKNGAKSRSMQRLVQRKDSAIDLNKLDPKALSAAMRGGIEGWGKWASASEHVRYSQPVNPRSRRRCYCGCKHRATHLGMANGICLFMGCKMAVERWVQHRAISPNKKGQA